MSGRLVPAIAYCVAAAWALLTLVALVAPSLTQAGISVPVALAPLVPAAMAIAAGRLFATGRKGLGLALLLVPGLLTGGQLLPELVYMLSGGDP